MVNYLNNKILCIVYTLQEFHEEKLWKIIKGPNRQTLLAPLVEIV